MKKVLISLTLCLLMCGCTVTVDTSNNSNSTKEESQETQTEDLYNSRIEALKSEYKFTALSIINAYSSKYALAELQGDEEKITILKNGFDGKSGSEVKEALDIKGDLPETFSMLHMDENENVIIVFTTGNIVCSNYDKDEVECY